MIKKASAVVGAILFLCITAFAVAAQTESMIVAPDYLPPASGMGFLGQEHHYTVTFRGNGEAVVAARLVFTNTTEATMSAMTLRVPKGLQTDAIAYQMHREPQCIRYESPIFSLPNLPNRGVSGGISFEESQSLQRSVIQKPICAEYQTQDYYQYWYGSNTYHKAVLSNQTDSITITLPKPVSPNTSGSLIVYYRSIGYAKRDSFGAFHYTFETMKVEDRIRTLNVGINVDSDLYMRGQKGEVEYQQTADSAAAPMMGMKQGTFEGVRSAQLDTYVQQIGHGQISKNASDLQPLDSYSVTGSYADAQWKLYGREISIWIIAALLIITLLVFLIRRIIRLLMARRAAASPAANSGASPDNMRIVAETGGISFISALLSMLYAAAVFFVITLISSSFMYGSSAVGFFAMMMLAVLSFAVIAFLLVGPAVYIGIKHGFGRAVIVFVATIIWLKLFFIVLVLFLFLTRSSSGYPGPIMPLMMRGEAVQDTGISVPSMMK